MRGFLIAALTLFLLYFFVFPFREPIGEWLAFRARGYSGFDWALRPWTWVTYPFLLLSPLALLFGGYWLYIVGGVLERSWGSVNFLVIFAALSVVAALGFMPAAYIFQLEVGLAGMWLPLTALLVAWATMDPEQPISFWFIPMKLKTLAVLDVLLVYFFYGFSFGPVGPVAALFALVAPAAAWYYVRKMPRLDIGFRAARPSRPNPRRLLREEPPSRERASGFNPLRRRQEQEEIARLRKLLGDDDDWSTTRH